MTVFHHLIEGAAAAALEPLVLLAVVLLVGWHLVAGTTASPDSAARDVRGVGRGSLLAALGTVLLVAGCSAAGLQNARGAGYQPALRQPAAHLATLLLLLGPLLVSLAAPALLTVGRLTARRASLIVIACWLGAAVAPSPATPGS